MKTSQSILASDRTVRNSVNKSDASRGLSSTVCTIKGVQESLRMNSAVSSPFPSGLVTARNLDEFLGVDCPPARF